VQRVKEVQTASVNADVAADDDGTKDKKLSKKLDGQLAQSAIFAQKRV
jgi:hypothetical protein